MKRHHSAPNTPDITVSTHASAGVVTTTHSFNSGPGSPATTSVSYIRSPDEERPPVQVVTNLTELTETIMVTQCDGKVIVTTQPRVETDPVILHRNKGSAEPPIVTPAKEVVSKELSDTKSTNRRCNGCDELIPRNWKECFGKNPLKAPLDK